MITAGWKKVNSDAWTGDNASAALKGFLGGATKSQEGGDVQ